MIVKMEKVGKELKRGLIGLISNNLYPRLK